MSHEREQRTIRAMIGIYCRGNHASGNGVPCGECERLQAYALARLARCPFGLEKPVCAKCPIHCYRKEMRDRIRAVMSYAGPRMAWRHPALAAQHLWQKRKPAPQPPQAAGGRAASSSLPLPQQVRAQDRDTQ
jgi:hypothetical protein